MRKKRESLKDAYYWLSILLVVTGAGYFVAQGVGADVDANLPAPVETGGRLEALRSIIENEDQQVVEETEEVTTEIEEEAAL